MIKILLAGLMLSACSRADAPAERNPLEAPPIDSARIGTLDEVSTWGYRRELAADLDGDQINERIVLTADVVVPTDGEPLWEDGHRWALYVESPAGERTLLYGAFVPNGHVEGALLAADSGGRRRVLVQERTPQQLRALEVEYVGPGVAHSSSSAYYQIEGWIPAPQP